MINPFAPVLQAGLDCLLPVLALMSGALTLGCLIGWTGKPDGKAEAERLRGELEQERRTVADSRTRLEKAGLLLTMRQKARDEELAVAQRANEGEVSALVAEVTSLKLALAAANRPAPRAEADPFRHATRLAELEREAAKVPRLLKEMEELRARPVNTVRRIAPTKPGAQPLPEQVYRLMSVPFGKRIEPDDLELVEGIGPKIAEHLTRHGLKTWADVAAVKPTQLRKVLDAAGDRFQMHDPAHWPVQCKLMVENRWDELRKYQRKLSSARG